MVGNLFQRTMNYAVILGILGEKNVFSVYKSSCKNGEYVWSIFFVRFHDRSGWLWLTLIVIYFISHSTFRFLSHSVWARIIVEYLEVNQYTFVSSDTCLSLFPVRNMHGSRNKKRHPKAALLQEGSLLINFWAWKSQFTPHCLVVHSKKPAFFLVSCWFIQTIEKSRVLAV